MSLAAADQHVPVTAVVAGRAAVVDDEGLIRQALVKGRQIARSNLLRKPRRLFPEGRHGKKRHEERRDGPTDQDRTSPGAAVARTQ